MATDRRAVRKRGGRKLQSAAARIRRHPAICQLERSGCPGKGGSDFMGWVEGFVPPAVQCGLQVAHSKSPTLPRLPWFPVHLVRYCPTTILPQRSARSLQIRKQCLHLGFCRRQWITRWFRSQRVIQRSDSGGPFLSMNYASLIRRIYSDHIRGLATSRSCGLLVDHFDPGQRPDIPRVPESGLGDFHRDAWSQ